MSVNVSNTEIINQLLKWRSIGIILYLSLAIYARNCYPWWCFFLGLAIFQLISIYYRSISIDPKSRGVLITGCDRGFGHALAKRLHSMNFTVFAGCHNNKSDGALELLKAGKGTGRMHVLQLDIISQKDVDEARQYVENNLPKLGLWAVVNNAGIAGCFSYLEWTKMEEFERLVSVNLFGLIRVTKAFLPLIRKYQGRVVNLSSILGRSVDHYTGPYAITKFGIEAFSDTLRLEMRPFNVKVSIIEPGNYLLATNIMAGPKDLIHIGHQTWERLEEPYREAYGIALYKRMIAIFRTTTKFSAKDITPAVDAITDAVYRKYPKDRYMPTNLLYEKIITLASCYIPSGLSDFWRISSLLIFYFIYGDE